MISATKQGRDKYLVFKASKELYGIKVDYLKEVHRPKKILNLPRTSKVLSGIINLRGYILSVFNFPTLLWGSGNDIDSGMNDEYSQPVVLVVSLGNQQVGILADEISQLVEVINITDTETSDFKGKKLSNPLIRTQIGSLADDQKVLIVDLESIFGSYLLTTQASDEIQIEIEDDEEFDLDQYTLADDSSNG